MCDDYIGVGRVRIYIDRSSCHSSVREPEGAREEKRGREGEAHCDEGCVHLQRADAKSSSRSVHSTVHPCRSRFKCNTNNPRVTLDGARTHRFYPSP